MAQQPGGRARGVQAAGHTLDNGQHLLIGAYTETLKLLRTLGVDEQQVLLRMPLCLVDHHGVGLRLNPGPAMPAFTLAVLRHSGWRLRDRLALLATATGWVARRFECDAALTVAALTARLPEAVRCELIDPLCVAALNTPATEASATVFLRVLKDSLFSGPGCADLLVPKVDLSALLPEPAQHWLHQNGAQLRWGTRVTTLKNTPTHWQVNGESFDRVILAASATEAARLTQTVAPTWSKITAALLFEPIVTVYAHSAGTRLAAPMIALPCHVALKSDGTSQGDLTPAGGLSQNSRFGSAAHPELTPAQFVFDRGQLGGPPGLLAFVISGAQPWVDAGTAATTAATLAQAKTALGHHLKAPLQVVQSITEKRATFRCTPGLLRPSHFIAPGLHAAGDYVVGEYPATLEAAVRSGLQAAASTDGVDG
jgi:hydroxysqualene dehydroxylase